jgi:hypothetical protein
MCIGAYFEFLAPVHPSFHHLGYFLGSHDGSLKNWKQEDFLKLPEKMTLEFGELAGPIM